MNVLITGITGFIGSHLAEKLLREGHKVFSVVRPTSNIENLSEKLRHNVKFYTYDDNRTVLEIFNDICLENNNPDVIYHLASNSLYDHKFEDIPSLIHSNITFGTEILDAMTRNNIYNFVNTGTVFQHYENFDYNPVNLYAATKEAFENIIAFYQTKGLHCINLHLFDTYGANDNRGKILNLLKKILVSGESLKMSPGEQFIDIVYIDDVSAAFALAGNYLFNEKYEYCGTYGVSSMNPVKLRELVKIFEEVAEKKLYIEWGARPYREREMMMTWTSFKCLPGWMPKINLRDGIKNFLNQ